MSGRKYALFALIASSSALLSIYAVFVTYQSWDLYHFLKVPGRGWRGTVHRSDAELGFAPIPGTRGAEVFAIGPEQPMRYDDDGFRIPVDASIPAPPERPLVLALGCSFTYGAATAAVDTYPYKVGVGLGGRSINAGVCSYGLAQMLVLARHLIGEHRPDYLMVQHSPWLVSRALSPFAPAYRGKMTNPYFYEGEDGFRLQPPLLSAALFDYPIGEYRETRPSPFDFLGFLGRVGFPIVIREHTATLAYPVGRALGILPPPAGDRDAVARAAYREIAEIAKDENAKMLVVLLDGAGQEADPSALDPGDGFSIVDAQGALLAKLPDRSRDAFLRHYGHWRGEPPELIDSHPNARAHAVIAETIVAAIERGL